MTSTKLQPRTANDDSESDRLTPLPTENEAWSQDDDADDDGRVICASASIPKVVHGSAVEPRHIVAERPDGTRTRKQFVWVTARRVAQIQQQYGRKQLECLRVRPLMELELSPVTSCFWLAGGAINKIAQKPGTIAISSATSGGQPNDPLTEASEQLQNIYNREGTLQVWLAGGLRNQSVILHGHCNIGSPGPSERLETEPTCLKCYTVNDISFDPNRDDLMVSAGNNGTIQLWQNGKKLDDSYYEYPRVPHDVAYRERDSLLAVTCMNGCVYVHHTQSHCYSLGDPVELRVAPQEVHHPVGSIVWGKGASADALFASSEAQDMSDFSGYHVAFDPDQGRRAYEFDIRESGDAMGLDPEGEKLALCTAADEGKHHLRLYDVRRKDGRRPLQHIQLDTLYVDPEHESCEGEVTAVKFSRDGLLLAVARSDDELHVYDSRFMGRSREPMSRFLHWEEDCCLSGDTWGIVDAVWVDGWCGRGMGVVTGGSDGCVRFWDVRRSGDDISNGEVIARPDSDIGHFSVGDPYNGEKPLVVGDNGGRIYVYDQASACHPTR
ncbi:WD40-repeat-containing domain protein [Russula dissimulans]|nr:WD40-repeat-containing domain protein [Russula dissimulans]